MFYAWILLVLSYLWHTSGCGVLQSISWARLFVVSDERFLIGSNDLHRFWESYYVGHAVNMKNFRDADKMLHPLCIVRCLQHHGSSSHRRRGPTVWTQTQSPGSTRAFVRFLTVRRIWRSASPLDGTGSGRLNLVPGVQCAQNVQFSGGSRKTAKIDNLRVLSKNPKKHEKNAFFGPLKKGAQLCGGSRRIIYCLDTRCGPQTIFGGIPGPPQNGGVGFGDRQIGKSRNSGISGFRGFCKLRILHRIRNSGSGIQFTDPPSGHHHVMGSRGKLAGPYFRITNIAKWLWWSCMQCMNVIPKVFYVDSVTNMELSQKRCRSFEL
jgi:hypothetical protein